MNRSVLRKKKNADLKKDQKMISRKKKIVEKRTAVRRSMKRNMSSKLEF